MRVEFLIAFAALPATGAFAQYSDHVFEPGTKHTCVPSDDRRSWICSDSQTSPPTRNEPSPPQNERADSAAPPATASRSGSSIPSYLLSPENRSSALVEAPAARSEPPTPAQKSVETSTPGSARRPAPVIPLPTSTVSSRAAPLDNDAFRAVASNTFVLELARGNSRDTAESARAAANLPHGRTYLLHFLHEDADWFVLVWGEFDSLDSARAARDEATAAGLTGVGFPRRAGPLQEEIRRAGH